MDTYVHILAAYDIKSCAKSNRLCRGLTQELKIFTDTSPNGRDKSMTFFSILNYFCQDENTFNFSVGRFNFLFVRFRLSETICLYFRLHQSILHCWLNE